MLNRKLISEIEEALKRASNKAAQADPFDEDLVDDAVMMAELLSLVCEGTKHQEEKAKKDLRECTTQDELVDYICTMQTVSDATGQSMYILFDTENGSLEQSRTDDVDDNYMVLTKIEPKIQYDDRRFYEYVFHVLGFDEDIFIAQVITKDGQGNDVMKWIMDHMRPVDRLAIETGYYMSRCTKGYIRRQREEAEKLVRAWFED